MAVGSTGDLRAVLMVVGALLVLVSAVPYVVAIVQGRTRPRLFSWIVWTLLGAIATVAAYAEGEYPSAALTAAATVETGGIVAAGWRFGNRTFERLDTYCLLGVVVGLILWAAFDSPLVGLMAALTIDVIAAVPTVQHAWRKPHEEAAVAYLLCAVAALCFLAAIREYSATGLLYPTYLLLINTTITVIVLRPAVRPRWFAPSRSTVPGTAQRPASRLLLLRPRAALAYGRHAAPVSRGRPHVPVGCSGPGRVGRRPEL
ncbi:MAG: hypothetical protein ACLGI3_09890 [Actinomycetes bacterium]